MLRQRRTFSTAHLRPYYSGMTTGAGITEESGDDDLFRGYLDGRSRWMELRDGRSALVFAIENAAGCNLRMYGKTQITSGCGSLPDLVEGETEDAVSSGTQPCGVGEAVADDPNDLVSGEDYGD